MSAFDNYDDWQKQQGGGAFSNYPGSAPGQPAQTPSPSASATSAPISPSAPGGAGQGPQAAGAAASSYDPNWKPSGNALWDFLSRPRAQTEGVGQAASDYGSAIADAGTFGFGDRLQSLMTGEDVNAIRARTAAAHDRLGLMDYPATAVAYAPYGAGAGALGLRGAGLISGALGGATEGTIAGGVGAYGHGDNPIVGAAEGAVGGGVGGGLSRVLNPVGNWAATKLGQATGALAKPEAITATLKDTRDQAYSGLKDVFYNPNDLLPHLDGAVSDIQAADPAGELTAGAPRSMAALNGLMDRVTDPSNPTQTAHSVLSTIDKLSDIQRAPNSGAENDIAPLIKDRLNNFLATANPVNPDLGPGAATTMISDAKAAHQQYANAKGLQDAGQLLTDFKTSPGAWARDTATQFYMDQTQPQNVAPYNALKNIVQAGGGGMGVYNTMHMVDPLLGYAGASVAGGPGAIAGEIAGHAMKPGIASILGAGQRRAEMSAMNQAYPALTGQSGPRATLNAGNALQNLIFGQGAAGQYPLTYPWR